MNRQAILKKLAEDLDGEVEAVIERIYALKAAAQAELSAIGEEVEELDEMTASDVLATGEVPEWLAEECN